MSTAVAAALARRVQVLEQEAEIARRLASFDDQGPDRTKRYRFIWREAKDFPVAVLCRACGVSRSAYYAWAKKGGGPDPATVDEAILANRIYDIWKRSRRRYGAPRVTAQLWRDGVPANKKRVARLMAELGIAGLCGRKKLKTTERDRTQPLAADLVERDFTAEMPDELWVTDVTYIPTDEGWLFLASILDVCTRTLLGWSMADHMRTELCLDALDAAARRRGRVRFVGTVLHSDHGCQYTSITFSVRCRAMGIVQSMGTVGDSYDNALAESFWSSLKRELVDCSHFTTREEARIAVFEWIMWYNTERLHSSLGYMPPVEYEESLETQDAA
ncbi:MAG: IS3 family transposase [Actinomycetota bacterium]|nr:IS3 family transposase [Actinomycetota bacterium]